MRQFNQRPDAGMGESDWRTSRRAITPWLGWHAAHGYQRLSLPGGEGENIFNTSRSPKPAAADLDPVQHN